MQAARGYVRTSAGQVHYRDAGEGFPLILLHKNPGSGRMFEAIVPLLAASHRVVAIDTPGYGGSDQPPERPSAEGYAAIIREAIDGLGIARFDLLGHHTGALFAALLAAGLPERVRRLAIIGYPWLSAEMTARLAASQPFAFDGTGNAVSAIIAELARGHGASATPHRQLRELTDRLLAGRDWHWAYLALVEANQAAPLDHLSMPSVFIAGRNDPIFSGTERAAKRAGAPFLAFEDAGILLPDEQPEALTAALTTFLDTLSYA